MGKTFLLTAAVFLGLSPTTARAATGNDLHRWCTDASAMALAYTSGIYDMVGFVEPKTICFPKGVTAGQAQDVVCRWLERNPGERHLHSAMVTLFAYGDTWPCGN